MYVDCSPTFRRKRKILENRHQQISDVISETLELENNAEAKTAWYAPIILLSFLHFQAHNLREQLCELIKTSFDNFEALDDFESYASQYMIVGNIEFKLMYLDMFLKEFGVCTSDHIILG